MDTPRDDDRDEPHFGSQQWENRLEERRSHPSKKHVAPPPISEYVRDGSVNDLREVLKELKVGESGPTLAKPDAWKWVGAAVAVITLVIGVAGSAQSVVASNQKLLDKIENMDARLSSVEKTRPENLQRLDAAIAENRSQADTINSIRESIAEERKQRAEDGAANRKALTDFMAATSKLADKLADVATDVAVMKAQGRRSEGPGPRNQPQRDAFVQPLPQCYHGGKPPCHPFG